MPLRGSVARCPIPTRAEILLMLRDGPGYPSDLAEKIGVSRQILSNHLACLRGCGLVIASPRAGAAVMSWPTSGSPTRSTT